MIPATILPFLSLGWSIDYHVTAAALRLPLKIFLFLVYLLNIFEDPRVFRLFLRSYLTTGVILTIGNILDRYFVFSEGIALAGRVGYLTSSPNEFGDHLLTLVPFFLIASMKPGWFSKFCLATLLLGMLWTYSRGSWIAFTVAALCITLLVDISGKKKLAVLLAAGCAAACLLTWLRPTTGQKEGYTASARIESLMALVAEREQIGSDMERLFIYNLGWEFVMEHPWTGVGTGILADSLSATVGREINPHSVVLDILSSTGLVGLALWLHMLLRLLILLIRDFRRSKGHSSLLLYVIASLIGASVHQCFFASTTRFYFWTILAIGITLTQRSRNKCPVVRQ